MDGILYPYALSGNTPQHIGAAIPGGLYKCLDCRERMVARLGEVNTPHFAHRVSNPLCSPESVLHACAKIAIVQGFTEAEEYPVGFPCPLCGVAIAIDLKRNAASIACEQSVVPGTRSDVVAYKADGAPRLIIEIVVTHDIQTEGTLGLYQAALYPVLSVSPTWETLEELRSRLIGEPRANISTQAHEECLAQQAAKRREERREAEQAERARKQRMAEQARVDQAYLRERGRQREWVREIHERTQVGFLGFGGNACDCPACQPLVRKRLGLTKPVQVSS